MILSKCSIEAMGYTEYPLTDVIEVHFGILKAYSLRGMVFRQDSEGKHSEVVSVADCCTAAIAQSINPASKMLVGDNSVEDEEQWLFDKNANPPFLLIHFREASPRELRGGYRQEKDGYIWTYDAFPEGRKDSREWEDEAIPSIVTSLTVNLLTLEQQVDLVLIHRTVFGITSKGQILFNLKVTSGSGSFYVSPPKSLEEINTSLEKSKELLPVLTKDVCRHFYTALNEPDKVKKFLGYFQFIERYTHSTYKSLNYSNDTQEASTVPSRVKEPATKFSDSNNLLQRFRWCSIIAWRKIEESDVICFLEVKKIRDQLSHGEHIEEEALPIDKAKVLALKLLGTN